MKNPPKMGNLLINLKTTYQKKKKEKKKELKLPII